jgi:hypothetical protein
MQGSWAIRTTPTWHRAEMDANQNDLTVRTLTIRAVRVCYYQVLASVDHPTPVPSVRACVHDSERVVKGRPPWSWN